MFWKIKEEAMPRRDVQKDAAEDMINAAKVLPAKRFMDLVYWAILDNKQLSIEDIDALSNRLARLAWERGRR